MPSADARHFDEYRHQTQVKHQILSKYLAAFCQIMKGQADKIIFFDGFAGRGTYDHDGVAAPGSPLLALEHFATDTTLRTKVTAIFNERDPSHFAHLQTAIQRVCTGHDGICTPRVLNESFSSALRETIVVADRTPGPPALFVFADPCGVDDLELDAIVDALRRPFCDVLLFFNVEGIRRILGLRKVGRDTPALDRLFGTRERVEAVAASVEGCSGTLLTGSLWMRTDRRSLQTSTTFSLSRFGSSPRTAERRATTCSLQRNRLSRSRS